MNKTTALLKKAVLQAAEAEGSDGNGKEGLVGYCRSLARDHPTAFTSLLGKIIPTQVDANVAVTTDPLRELLDYVQQNGKRLIDFDENGEIVKQTGK
ncbi:hypothetical protein AAFN47_18780 [Hoeflea sp. CAU 1731]